MRFGVREICNVVFKARTETKIGTTTFKKGQPVLYIDTAKTSTLEGAATTVYAQGGQGNPRLIAWEGERTLTFTVEDALLSPTSFAILTGAGLTNMASAGSTNKINVHTTFDLPILDGGIVKIDLDTAGENHDIFYDEDTAEIFGFILDNSGAGVVPCQCTGISGVTPNCNVYTITADNELVLTFSGADKYVGKTLRVDCYTQKTGGATEITIDAEKFAGNYYVEADTLFRDEYSAQDMPAVIVIPNVKIQSNFTFNMSNTGDPSTFTFTMDAFPDYTKFDKTHKVFAAIQIVGDENIHPDNPEEVEVDDNCGELELAFDSVVAGANDWATKEFPGDPKKINFVTLGNNLKATVDRANVDFSGNLRRVDNWTAFSSKPEDLTGYYFPFTMTATDGSKLVRTGLSGEEKTLVFGQTGDGEGKINMVWAVNPNAPVVTVKLVSADDATTTEYAFDFSKVVFK